MALTTRDDLLVQTQIQIPELLSTDEAVRQAAENNIDAIIERASQRLISMIGFNPVSVIQASKNFILNTTTSTVQLPEYFRSYSSASITDSGTELTPLTPTTPTNTLRFSALLTEGTQLTITAVYGLAENLETLGDQALGARIQQMANALTYTTLFKEGVVRSRNQGSDSTNYGGMSWLDRRAIDDEIQRITPYANAALV